MEKKVTWAIDIDTGRDDPIEAAASALTKLLNPTGWCHVFEVNGENINLDELKLKDKRVALAFFPAYFAKHGDEALLQLIIEQNEYNAAISGEVFDTFKEQIVSRSFLTHAHIKALSAAFMDTREGSGLLVDYILDRHMYDIDPSSKNAKVKLGAALLSAGRGEQFKTLIEKLGMDADDLADAEMWKTAAHNQAFITYESKLKGAVELAAEFSPQAINIVVQKMLRSHIESDIYFSQMLSTQEIKLIYQYASDRTLKAFEVAVEKANEQDIYAAAMKSKVLHERGDPNSGSPQNEKAASKRRSHRI